MIKNNIFVKTRFLLTIKQLTTMNKADLIDAIAAESSLTKADSSKALNAIMSVIGKTLKTEKVTLVGFGTFSTSERAARIGRNPATGKEIKIAAKKVVSFKAGSELLETVK